MFAFESGEQQKKEVCVETRDIQTGIYKIHTHYVQLPVCEHGLRADDGGGRL
jgi:hypothetical protein